MTKHSDDWSLLRQKRLRLGWTQQQMADRLNTPLVTYKSWETGRYKPPGVAIAFVRLITAASGRSAKYDHDEFERLYREGRSVASIAQACGCTRKTVDNALRSRGIVLKGHRLIEDDAAVARRYLDGETQGEIAQSIGVSRAAIQSAVRRALISGSVSPERRAARLTYFDRYRARHRPSPELQARDGLPPLGAMEFSDAGDRVRCHVCGRWYKALNAHLRTHDHDEASYKEAFGLKRTASLLPPVTAEKFRQRAIERDQGAIGRQYIPAAAGRPKGQEARLQHRVEASEARKGRNMRAGEKTNDR